MIMTDQNAPTYFVASVIGKCKTRKFTYSKISPRPQNILRRRHHHQHQQQQQKQQEQK